MGVEISVSDAVLVSDSKDLRRVLKQAGQEIATKAKQLITSSKGGPGSAPQNRTGNLANNMTVKVKGETVTISDNATSAGTGSTFYALFLEAGAKASQKRGGKDKRGRLLSQDWKITPHPFLSTALEEIAPDLGDRIGKAVLDGISLKVTNK